MEVILMKDKLFIILTMITLISSITKVIKISSIENNITFAMIKPDAVQAKNDGKIVHIIKQHGFKIMNMKETLLAKKDAKIFYALHKNKPFFCKLVTFVTSGPIIVMVLKKENAIQGWRKLMGATDPKNAAPGTIRKLFGTNITANAVHGSDAWQTAQQEIRQFFPDLAISPKKLTTSAWKEQQHA